MNRFAILRSTYDSPRWRQTSLIDLEMNLIMPNFRHLVLTALALSLILGLNGCASQKKKEDNRPPEEIYLDSQRALKKGNYTDAIEYLSSLQSRYPFGSYAQQAQLELIFAHYKKQEWEDAVIAADRFIKDYPNHRHIDYAYYMKGVCNYERSLGLLEKSLPRMSTGNSDPQFAKSAFDSFSLLVRRYPASEYAVDARQHMIFLRNRLAEHELASIDYYYRRGAYVAVIRRGEDLLSRYQGTPSAFEALELMAKSYRKLGKNDLAEQTEQLLTESKKAQAATPIEPKSAAKAPGFLAKLNPF